MRNDKKKLLVIRNDKLGDFMLAFPAFHLLKNSIPNVRLHALVPQYTEEMAQACTAIDQIIIDPGPNAPRHQQLQTAKQIAREQFDAVVTLFSTTRIGIALFAARIPYRLAPATKLAQIFYNHRLTQRRSRSEKPEFEYNVDLARKLLQDFNYTPQLAQPPYLNHPQAAVDNLRKAFCRQHNINSTQPIVFIHPGSGGSANNLSLQQYASLVNQLSGIREFSVVISAGPNELDIANQLGKMLKDISYAIYHSNEGLIKFSQHIQFADVFIGGSTGPLHIAGALNTPTAGFYTRRRSATSLRWQTLNSPDKRLAFSPPEQAEEQDMMSIDLSAAAKVISKHFLAD